MMYPGKPHAGHATLFSTKIKNNFNNEQENMLYLSKKVKMKVKLRRKDD